MEKLPWTQVHFTGIGGVGMTGLALILDDFGVRVSGTDMVESTNTRMLRERGCRINIGHAADHVETPDILVFSSAVQPDNPERQQATELGIPQIRRGDFLADLAKAFPQRVSCAGSHGKTTVSAMLSHILIETGCEPGYMVGGTVPEREFPAAAGRREILVTEVDESDGTQAKMLSTHAIVTNAEDDHCWSVGGIDKLKECFRTFAARSDFLLAYDLPETRELFSDHPQVEFLGPDDVRSDLQLLVPGDHNRINATLSIRMAARLSVAEADAVRAMQTFPGVDRRQSVRYEGSGVLVIEDYAHHPTEVRATIQALRERHPDKRLRLVFQPHRFERIARYGTDFSRELAAADDVVVVPTFAAWLDDAEKGDPAAIAAGISGIPARFDERPYKELADDLAQTADNGDLIAVFGAGSVTKLIPLLIEALKKGGK